MKVLLLKLDWLIRFDGGPLQKYGKPKTEKAGGPIAGPEGEVGGCAHKCWGGNVGISV